MTSPHYPTIEQLLTAAREVSVTYLNGKPWIQDVTIDHDANPGKDDPNDSLTITWTMMGHCQLQFSGGPLAMRDLLHAMYSVRCSFWNLC